MTLKKNEAQATARLSELLAEELMSLSGRELQEAARAWGVDPATSAERVDEAFRSATKSRNQERLRAAKAAHAKVVEKLSAAKSAASGNRDALIEALSERLADLRRNNPTGVTIQHRNLCELSEADLVSLLGQLSALEEK